MRSDEGPVVPSRAIRQQIQEVRLVKKKKGPIGIRRPGLIPFAAVGSIVYCHYSSIHLH